MKILLVRLFFLIFNLWITSPSKHLVNLESAGRYTTGTKMTESLRFGTFVLFLCLVSPSLTSGLRT